MTNEQFDDIIKRGMDEHEAPVPSDAWDNIVREKKKRRPIVFFWWAILGLLILGGTGIITSKKILSNKHEQQFEKNDNKKEQDKLVEYNNKLKENKHATNGPTKIFIIDSDKNKTNPAATNLFSDKLIDQNNQDEELNENKTGEKNANNNNNGLGEKKNSHATKFTAGFKRNYILKNIGNQKNERNDFANETMQKEIETSHSKIYDIEPLAKNELKPIASVLFTKNNDSNFLEAEMNAISALKTVLFKNDSTALSSLKNKKKNKFKSNWEVALGVTPLLSFQNYKQPIYIKRTTINNNSKTVYTANLVNTSLIPNFAFSVSAFKSIGPKFKIGIGLQYQELKEKINLTGIDTITTTNIVNKLVYNAGAPSLVNDTMYTTSFRQRNINAQNSYTFIDLPVSLQYQLMENRRWAFSLQVGIQFDIYRKYHNNIDGDLISNDANAKKSGSTIFTNTSLMAGFKATRMLNKKWNAFLMPVLNYRPTYLHIKDAILDKRIQQIGISFGLGYKL